MPKRWNFKGKRAQLQRTKTRLPRALALVMLRFQQRSFRIQGWHDGNFNPWKARKRKERGRRRAILVKSGALRKSLNIRQATWRLIKVGSYGIPYSRRHNRGLDNMPQRQFLGPSRTLTRQIKKRLNLELKKILRQ